MTRYKRALLVIVAALPLGAALAASATPAARISYLSSRHHAEQFGVMIPAIAVGIAWAPDALLRNVLETLPVLRKQGSISGRCFVPPNDDIAIGGVIFDQTGSQRRYAGEIEWGAACVSRALR